MSRPFGLLVAVLSLAILTSCASRPADQSTEPVPVGREGGTSSLVTTTTPPHPGGMVAIDTTLVAPSEDATYAKPGVYSLPQERKQALGTLEYGSVAGAPPAYWLCAVYPWESEPLVPVVRLEGADMSLAYSNVGRFVSVDGRLVDETLNVEQMWVIGGDPGPFDWLHARTEKPHQMRLPDGKLRAVGVLTYVERFRDVNTERWAVMLAAPGSSPYTTARVGAFLETPPSASLAALELPYVAVEGTVIDGIRASGTDWPVVRISTLTTVATVAAVEN